MNEKRLCRSLDALMWFIDESLGIDREKQEITGFQLINPLTEAAAHNTYVETVSNKADTLYRRIKESLTSMTEHAYLNYIKKIAKNIQLDKKSVILAFDYTDENFYGDVQGINIHGWNGKEGITGHFKFITCSIVAECAPFKIPLISLPIRIGHYKSSAILHCLDLIKGFIGKIDLILFDRGFYDNDLMYELTKLNYPYLIFVPAQKEYKNFLKELEKGTTTIVVRDYEVRKDLTKLKGERILAFLREIYDPRSEKNYDWIFATNVEKVILGDILSTYKKRWVIETQFRVQDEATIKCKSKDMKIRYFIFLFEQMLQTIWICFYKKESTFKGFLIELEKMSKKWTKADKT